MVQATLRSYIDFSVRVVLPVSKRGLFERSVSMLSGVGSIVDGTVLLEEEGARVLEEPWLQDGLCGFVVVGCEDWVAGRPSNLLRIDDLLFSFAGFCCVLNSSST